VPRVSLWREISLPRLDISDKVIHFTKGDNDEDAYSRLRAIVSERRVIASGNKIKGESPCVCFTEAPLSSLSGGLVNPKDFGRYSLFGLMFDKNWIFGLGGRPVIYQPDLEFQNLPDALKWRHMRYEPNGTPPIDFTWEREWRFNGELLFNPGTTVIVVPNLSWAQRLEDEHDEEQEYEVRNYSLTLGETVAEMYRERFPWRITYFV
jgi:hypothetical protein